jgi:GxxExxY protein
MTDNYIHSNLTNLIIKAFFKVYNKLGYGFLERVYQNALVIELTRSGLKCSTGFPIDVFYNGHKVWFYIADIIVNDFVVIENKAAESLCEEHEFQLVNYLKATKIEVGLLLNFGKKPQFKRKVFSQEYKS